MKRAATSRELPATKPILNGHLSSPMLNGHLLLYISFTISSTTDRSLAFEPSSSMTMPSEQRAQSPELQARMHSLDRAALGGKPRHGRRAVLHMHCANQVSYVPLLLRYIHNPSAACSIEPSSSPPSILKRSLTLSSLADLRASNTLTLNYLPHLREYAG